MSILSAQLALDVEQPDPTHWAVRGYMYKGSNICSFEEWAMPRSAIGVTRVEAEAYVKGWNAHRKQIAELMFEKRVLRSVSARD